MGRYPSLGKRQEGWINDAVSEVGPNPIKVYYLLIDRHPRLCPSRLQTISYVNKHYNSKKSSKKSTAHLEAKLS